MMKGIYEKILIFKIFWKFTAMEARQIGVHEWREMYKYVHYF